MRFFSGALFLLAATVIICCKDSRNTKSENPAAEGFDLANSDPAGVELADSIMVAMGGRQAWDETETISWETENHTLIWNKQKNKVRIEFYQDSTIYLLNTDTFDGKVQIRGQELTQPDSLRKRLQRARQIWLNDSYSLLMPFMLKEAGVALKYLGEATIRNGAKHNLLQVTFQNKGSSSPGSKFLAYVDLKDNLVKQWAIFQTADQDSASMVLPFDNYKKYGRILLSADRSDGRGPKNVKVDERLPGNTFSEF